MVFLRLFLIRSLRTTDFLWADASEENVLALYISLEIWYTLR